MADAQPNHQPDAMSAAPEPEPHTSQASKLPEATQPAINAAEALEAITGQQQPRHPQDAKLDPAGFFTLVNNTRFGASSSTAQQAHHPRIRYIFADDDPAELTAALAEAHEINEARAPPAAGRDHGIVVDVAPVTDPATGKATGGWKVTSASSMSGEFAVTGARISRMEDSASAGGTPVKARAGAEAEEGAGAGGLMLRIDGVQVTEDDTPEAPESLGTSQSAEHGAGAGAREEYAAVVEDFDRNMGLVRKILAAGEKKADAGEQRAVSGASREKDVHRNDHSDGDSG